ncbi:MAG TPA: lysophospholipase [Steroidobacteraceae bacterium]|nr:lysophospholipase [Steroidobacteraceae bacterium]
MRHATGEQQGRKGRRLFQQEWLPDGEVRAAVVLAHGLAEHSGRYGELVARLTARQLAVYALDHRGHGRSTGARAYIESFDWLVDDLTQRIRAARTQHPGQRLFLIGHSLGGTAALLATLDHPELVDRLVLSAPAIGTDPDVPRGRLAIARLLSAVAPIVGVLRLPAAAISRDPFIVRNYESDPLVYRGLIPARTVVELLGAMQRAGQRAPELRAPTLVLHGTADALVPLRLTRPVYARLGAPDLTVKLYEGLFHELFNEPERDRVFADLEAWLDAHA